MSDLVCTICAAAASTPPCRLELGMSGFLSAEDAALCAFPATQGFTCIDHTVCTDCLLEAKNAGSKCQPIADLQPSQSRGYVQRHSLAHFDAATQTAGTWLCQTHRGHRSSCIGGEEQAVRRQNICRAHVFATSPIRSKPVRARKPVLRVQRRDESRRRERRARVQHQWPTGGSPTQG